MTLSSITSNPQTPPFMPLSTEINMHVVRAVSFGFFGGLLRARGGEIPLRELWRAAPERVGVRRSVETWFWRRVTCSQACIFVECYYQSQPVNDFSAFLNMGRCKNLGPWSFFSWKYLPEGLFCQFAQEYRGPRGWCSLEFYPGCVAGQWVQGLMSGFLQNWVASDIPYLTLLPQPYPLVIFKQTLDRMLICSIMSW